MVENKEFIPERILETEFSEEFVRMMKNRMLVSYMKYGAAKENHGGNGRMNAMEDIKLRLDKYKETRNTEFLVDVANYAMIEFMLPSLEGAHFTPTDSGACRVSGKGVNQIR